MSSYLTDVSINSPFLKPKFVLRVKLLVIRYNGKMAVHGGKGCTRVFSFCDSSFVQFPLH